MRRLLFLTIGLLYAAPAMAAEELQLGWRSGVEYDSELLSRNGGEDDEIVTFGPTLEFEGTHRTFGYGFEWSSAFEKYVNTSELDDWRHEISVHGNWSPTPRIQLSFTEGFRQLTRLHTSTDELLPGVINTTGETDFNVDTGKIQINVVTASVTVTPSEKLTGSFSVSNLFQQFDDPNLTSQDVLSTTLSNSLTYQIAESHRFGGGFRYSTRDFDVGGRSEENTTETFNAFGIWTWRIDSRSTLSVTGGPAWSGDETRDPTFPRYGTTLSDFSLLADPATCQFQIPAAFLGLPIDGAILDGSCTGISQTPLTEAQQEILADLDAFPGLEFGSAEDQDDVNLFFNISLGRRWSRLELLASWNRSDSQTQSLGSATIVDSLTGTARYQITSRTHANLRFSFTRRFTDIDREVNTPIISASGGLNPLLPGTTPIPELGGAVEGPLVIGRIPTDQKFESTNDIYTLGLSFTRTLGRYSSAFVGIDYRLQDSETKTEFQTLNFDGDHWQMTVGFDYRFRPVRF